MLCTLLLGREESTDGVMNVGAEADCATFTVDHAELVNRGKIMRPTKWLLSDN